jgi:hypothetical protein
LKDGGFWASPTSDYGPRGCRVVAPVQLDPGARVFLELENERVPGKVELAGRVAWGSRAPPWHTGLIFDDASLETAGRFFDRLAAAYPGIDAYGRAPDRIPETAPLAPAPPPPFQPLLTADEVRLLRELGAGARADALKARIVDWERAVHALFALFGRRYVVMGEPDPRAAAAWGSLLGDGG